MRPDSIDKADVSTLRDLGVEIRPSDWEKASADELDKLFDGAEIVISTCHYTSIPSQTVLVDAAKRAGVKRFIPCDFGTPAPRGVMGLRDGVSTDVSKS